jgi:hypothetical protein
MRLLLRIGLIGAACLAGAFLVALLITQANIDLHHQLGEAPRGPRSKGQPVHTPKTAAVAPHAESIPIYSAAFLEDSGYKQAVRFTPDLPDNTLATLRTAIGSRGRKGMEYWKDQLALLEREPSQTQEVVRNRSQAQTSVALLNMYEGDYVEAERWIGAALETASAPYFPPLVRANLRAMQGVAALRRGETDNCIACIGPSSCIFPLVPEARHVRPSGSRDAVAHFTAYLKERPEDMGVRWLLNVASMTLGEYPDKVPPEYRLSLAPYRSKLEVGRFPNVANQVGLEARGANLAGGSIFDDFTGDGLPDLLITSFDSEMGAGLFVNQGNGTFEDRTASAGIADQVLSLNCSHADYDNDGRLDVFLMRGGWELAYRQTLLHNIGDGHFADVTEAAGMGVPISCQSAAWGDYDNDGWVDVFVVGEYRTAGGGQGSSAWATGDVQADPRNYCRLYHNRGDFTFEDVAEAAGVRSQSFAKGAAWGDYDDDGDLDLFVSNNSGPCRLYRNDGRGRFEDVAAKLGVAGPINGFACWFWDFDNDGRLDIYVNNFDGTLESFVRGTFGTDPQGLHPGRPRLYRNLGPQGFQNVAPECGLDKPVLAMGANFGDIDNDGFLDMYHGTGAPAYSMLIPKILYKNVDGRRFEDVTTSSGTGHLQKGHGVSFADYDNDGDLDLFAQLGGAVPGDKAYNALFRNPGHGRHWLNVKLVGTKTNRAAIGVRIRADVEGPDGRVRSIYRVVGCASSFGGNTLVEHLGLKETSKVRTLTITWPTSRTTQTFQDVPGDRTIEITEGASEYRTTTAPRASP